MVKFLIDYCANFSGIDRYIKSEITNPTTTAPGAPLSPVEVARRAKTRLQNAALVGGGKFVYDKKLNRRQKRTVNKFLGAINPQQPATVKRPFFFNPFAKKPVTPPPTGVKP
jgi:hypothetical protein